MVTLVIYLCTKFEVYMFSRSIYVLRVTKIEKAGHVTHAMPLLTYFLIFFGL